jgi:hypothetical protein
MTDSARALLAGFQVALGVPMAPIVVTLSAGGSLRSVFAVTDLAQSSMGAAGASLASLIGLNGAVVPEVVVDRDLASAWFQLSIRPQGRDLPPL